MHPYLTELLIRFRQAELQKLAADCRRLPPRQRRWPTVLARVRWNGPHRTAPPGPTDPSKCPAVLRSDW